MKGLAIGLGMVLVGVGLHQLTVSQVAGDWEGESKCVNLKVAPNCHDEHVIYHITAIAKKDDLVHLSADKVVNKKPEPMGDFDFHLDPKRSTITNQFEMHGNRGEWKFYVKGDYIDGTLTRLPGHEIIRKVSVKKVVK